MRKLLIAEHSEALASALENALQEQWAIHICADGYAAIDALQYFVPDAMILDLNLLQKDGLAVLEDCFPNLPPVILALTNFVSPYIAQTAASLGVGYMMQIPCPIGQIKTRLTDMYAANMSPPNALVQHLKALQLNPNHAGYRYLLAAIPAFKEDPQQLLSKEVYPRVIAQCNVTDGRSIERLIRYAIQTAWKTRNIRTWSQYFPQNESGDVDCPNVKDFIQALADKI